MTYSYWLSFECPMPDLGMRVHQCERPYLFTFILGNWWCLSALALTALAAKKTKRVGDDRIVTLLIGLIKMNLFLATVWLLLGHTNIDNNDFSHFSISVISIAYTRQPSYEYSLNKEGGAVFQMFFLS